MVSYRTKAPPVRRIKEMIFLIRGRRVMLDSVLARIFSVTTAALNQALKRNRDRFPDDFAFQVTESVSHPLISQIVTSKGGRGGRRKLPSVFTELGALMLGNILNARIAIEASIS